MGVCLAPRLLVVSGAQKLLLIFLQLLIHCDWMIQIRTAMAERTETSDAEPTFFGRLGNQEKENGRRKYRA